MTASPIILNLPDEAATADFAAAISALLLPGDVILLQGEIGAGKSAFARALIRYRAGADVEVPSPTFTLVQTYDIDDLEIWHCDLYRLSHPDEVFELGLDGAFETAICLIEWPDRLGELAPKTALTLQFAAQADHHSVTCIPNDAWDQRIAKIHG